MNKMALAMIWLAVLLAGCGGFVARRRQCRPKPGWRVLRCAEYRHRADQPLGGAASKESVEKVLQQRAWWHAARGRLGRLLSDQLVRNGYRDRTLDTRLGALQLRIPKLRQRLPSRQRGAAAFRP